MRYLTAPLPAKTLKVTSIKKRTKQVKTLFLSDAFCLNKKKHSKKLFDVFIYLTLNVTTKKEQFYLHYI
jgi:hypothetical protein